MTNASRPDTDGLISGGQQRRRRRNLAVAAAAAAVVVLVGGGVYGVARAGGDDPKSDAPVATEPTGSTDAAESTDAPPAYEMSGGEPGTYRRSVGVTSQGEAIYADWTFEDEGWDLGDHPVLRRDGDWAGASVYRPTAFAGEDPCTSDPEGWPTPGRPAADSVDAVGRQLTQLPGSTVVEPPTTTEAFGYPAVHLTVRVEDSCVGSDVYCVAKTDSGPHGVSYWPAGKPVDVVLDFLVVDVDGTPVIAEYWHHPGADQALVSKVTAVRDSISFVPLA